METRLHSLAVGVNGAADALLFFLFIFFKRVRSVIWWHGDPSRTKSQGQISWLCRDNSWEQQTRKSFHFITDSAGGQESSRAFLALPAPLITLLLPPVCRYTHTYTSSIVSVGWLTPFPQSGQPFLRFSFLYNGLFLQTSL